MNGTHWLALGLVFSGLATQAAGVHDWAEVFSPKFIFGSMGVVGGVLVGLFSKQLFRDPTQQERRTDRPPAE